MQNGLLLAGPTGSDPEQLLKVDSIKNIAIAGNRPLARPMNQLLECWRLAIERSFSAMTSIQIKGTAMNIRSVNP